MDCLQKIGYGLRHRASPKHTPCCQGVARWPIAWLLLLLALLLSAPMTLVGGSSESIPLMCVYANSSASQCSSLCPEGCFYSFLPSYCSEEGLQLVFSSESRPGTQFPSVNLSTIYPVPDSVSHQIPPDVLHGWGVTIAFWLRPAMPSNGVLLHIQLQNGTLTLYVDSEYLTVISDETPEVNTSISLTGMVWHHVALVFPNQSDTTVINIYHNGSFVKSMMINLTPGLFSAIYLAGSPDEAGSGAGLMADQQYYSGLIQDVGLYSRPLTDSEISSLAGGVISLSNASFLLQCLCPPDQVANNDVQTCGGDSVNRYNATDRAAEFAADGEALTYWQSNGMGDQPVYITVGFEAPQSLSKIFVVLNSTGVTSAILQYLRPGEMAFSDLQEFSISCPMQSPDVETIDEVVCDAIDPTSNRLEFYVGAFGRSVFGSQPLSTFFSAMQIRLVLKNGTMTFAIAEIETCADFDLNYNNSVPSCITTAVTPTATAMDATPSTVVSSTSTNVVESVVTSFVIEPTTIISSSELPGSQNTSSTGASVQETFSATMPVTSSSFSTFTFSPFDTTAALNTMSFSSTTGPTSTTSSLASIQLSPSESLSTSSSTSSAMSTTEEFMFTAPMSEGNLLSTEITQQQSSSLEVSNVLPSTSSASAMTVTSSSGVQTDMATSSLVVEPTTLMVGSQTTIGLPESGTLSTSTSNVVGTASQVITATVTSSQASAASFLTQPATTIPGTSIINTSFEFVSATLLPTVSLSEGPVVSTTGASNIAATSMPTISGSLTSSGPAISTSDIFTMVTSSETILPSSTSFPEPSTVGSSTSTSSEVSTQDLFTLTPSISAAENSSTMSSSGAIVPDSTQATGTSISSEVSEVTSPTVTANLTTIVSTTSDQLMTEHIFTTIASTGVAVTGSDTTNFVPSTSFLFTSPSSFEEAPMISTTLAAEVNSSTAQVFSTSFSSNFTMAMSTSPIIALSTSSVMNMSVTPENPTSTILPTHTTPPITLLVTSSSESIASSEEISATVSTVATASGVESMTPTFLVSNETSVIASESTGITLTTVTASQSAVSIASATTLLPVATTSNGTMVMMETSVISMLGSVSETMFSFTEPTISPTPSVGENSSFLTEISMLTVTQISVSSLLTTLVTTGSTSPLNVTETGSIFVTPSITPTPSMVNESTSLPVEVSTSSTLMNASEFLSLTVTPSPTNLTISSLPTTESVGTTSPGSVNESLSATTATGLVSPSVSFSGTTTSTITEVSIIPTPGNSSMAVTPTPFSANVSTFFFTQSSSVTPTQANISETVVSSIESNITPSSVIVNTSLAMTGIVSTSLMSANGTSPLTSTQTPSPSQVNGSSAAVTSSVQFNTSSSESVAFPSTATTANISQPTVSSTSVELETTPATMEVSMTTMTANASVTTLLLTESATLSSSVNASGSTFVITETVPINVSTSMLTSTNSIVPSSVIVNGSQPSSSIVSTSLMNVTETMFATPTESVSSTPVNGTTAIVASSTQLSVNGTTSVIVTPTESVSSTPVNSTSAAFTSSAQLSANETTFAFVTPTESASPTPVNSTSATVTSSTQLSVNGTTSVIVTPTESVSPMPVNSTSAAVANSTQVSVNGTTSVIVTPTESVSTMSVNGTSAAITSSVQLSANETTFAFVTPTESASPTPVNSTSAAVTSSTQLSVNETTLVIVTPTESASPTPVNGTTAAATSSAQLSVNVTTLVLVTPTESAFPSPVNGTSTVVTSSVQFNFSGNTTVFPSTSNISEPTTIVLSTTPLNVSQTTFSSIEASLTPTPVNVSTFTASITESVTPTSINVSETALFTTVNGTEIFTTTASVSINETSSVSINATQSLSPSSTVNQTSTILASSPQFTMSSSGVVGTPNATSQPTLVFSSSVVLNSSSFVTTTIMQTGSAVMPNATETAQSIVEPTSSAVISSTEFFSGGGSSLEPEISSTAQTFSTISTNTTFVTITPSPTTSIFSSPETSIQITATSTGIQSSPSLTTSVVSTAVSAMPSPAVFPSVEVTPTVEVGGAGILLRGPGQNPMTNTLKFGVFGAVTTGVTNGSITAKLGPLVKSVPFIPKRLPLTFLTGAVSTDTLWPDKPTFTVAVQARDSDGNTAVEPFFVMVLGRHSLGSINTTCIIESTLDSTCSTTLTVEESWFDSVPSLLNVSVVDQEQSLPETFIASIKLRTSTQQSLNNTVYIALPLTPLFRGESRELQLMAMYPYRILGFNIDCNISGGGEIVSASSPKQWSLLFDYYRDQTNRVALTGFRNRDTNNVQPTGGLPELLTTLIISVPELLENNITNNITFNCDVVDLRLTTGEQLATVLSPIAVRIISREGDLSYVGSFPTANSNQVKFLFPFFANNTLLNMASVKRSMQLLGAVDAKVLLTNGSLVDSNLGSIECQSENEDIIQVTKNCSILYFTGQESSGGPTNITVTHLDSSTASKLPISVWLVGKNVTITPQDTHLNYTPSCNGSSLSPASKISITSTLTFQDSMEIVDLTALLISDLNVTNDSVLIIDGDQVIANSPGVAEVYVISKDVGTTEIIVTQEITQLQYLSLYVFTELSIEFANDEGAIPRITSQLANITLLQDLAYEAQPVYVHTTAVFSDGKTLEVDNMTGLELTVNGEKIEGGQFMIGGCMKTVLINATLSSPCGGQVTGRAELNVTLLPPELKISSSSDNITPITDPLLDVMEVPNQASLTLTLTYPNSIYNTDISMVAGNYSNATVSDSSILTVETGGSGEIVVRPMSGGIATVTVTTRPQCFNLTLTESVTMTVIETKNLSVIFHPYPAVNGSNTSLTSLRRLSSSSFQQAAVYASLLLSNNDSVPLEPNDITSIHTNNSDLLSVDNMSGLLYVLDPPSASTAACVTVTMGALSHSSLITVSTSTLQIEKVVPVIDDEISVTAGMVVIADCKIQFMDGTFLSSTFDSDGNPLYGDLVEVMTSISDVASVSNGTSVVTIHKTSLIANTLSCIASNNTGTKSFSSIVLPGEGAVALTPVTGSLNTSVTINDNISISVVVTSNASRCGVFEVAIAYNSNMLSLLDANVEQGGNWSNGSLVVVQTDSDSLLVGGVLNSGSQGEGLEVARLTFRALNAGHASLSTSLEILAAANINLTNLIDQSLPSEITFEIGSQQTKRNADQWSASSTARTRRQIENPCKSSYPVGDINGDCKINLLDVYYFQEYSHASIHGFTSEVGSEILEEVQSNNITVDADGDGVVSLGDVVFVEQVGSGLVFELTLGQPQLTRDFCDYRFEIGGDISDGNGSPVPIDNLHVFVHMAHTDMLFLTQFVATTLFYNEETTVSYMYDDSLSIYSVLISASLSVDNQNRASYKVEAKSSMSMTGIGISVLQVVTDPNGQVDLGRISGLFGSHLLPDTNSTEYTIRFSVNGEPVEYILQNGLRPHLFANLSRPESPPPFLPPLPLQLSTTGAAVVSDTVTQPDEDSNLVYQVNVALLTDTTTDSVFSVGLAGLESSTIINSQQPQPNELRNPISIPDQSTMMLYGYVQVYNNYTFSSGSESTELNVSLKDLSEEVYSTLCTPNSDTGLCSVKVPLLSNYTSVQLEFSLPQGMSVTTMERMLCHTPVWEVSQGVAVLLPPHPIVPGSLVNLVIYANTSYPLLSFLLEISITPAVVIMGTSSSGTWGVAYHDSRYVGYRSDFQHLSDSPSDQAEHLFNLTVQVPADNSATPVDVTVNVLELRDIFYRNITTEAQQSLVVNGSDAFPNRASFSITEHRIIQIYPFTNQTELVNTAALNHERISVNISVMAIYTNGTAAILEDGLECTVDGIPISLHVASDCSEVFLNGSEETGSDKVDITILHSETGINSTLSFRVIHPSLPVHIQLSRHTLYRIDTLGACDDYLYQSAVVTITTNFSTGGTPLVQDADVTDLVLPLVNKNTSGIVEVDVAKRSVTGLDPGVVELYSDSGLTHLQPIEVVVSDELRTVDSLYGVIITDIDLMAPSQNGIYQHFTISLDSSFHYHNATGTVVAIAIFDDNSSMLVSGMGSLELGALSSGLVVENSAGNSVLVTSNFTGQLVEMQWDDDGCNECIQTGTITSSVSIPNPTGLVYQVFPNITQLAASDEISTLLSIPQAVSLSVSLRYDDGTIVDVTDHVEISSIHLLDISDFPTITATSPDSSGSANIMLTFDLNEQIFSVTVELEVINFDITLSEISTALVYDHQVTTNALHRIEMSSVYTQAVIIGMIYFTDGSSFSLDEVTFGDFTTDPPGIISINNNKAVVNTIPSTNTNVSITFVSPSAVTISQTSILVKVDDSLDIMEITWPEGMEEKFTGLPGTTVELDLMVSLSGESSVLSLRSLAGSYFTSLVGISSSDESILSVNDLTAVATLHGNSPCGVNLSASTMSGSVQNSSVFFVNTNPTLGRFDIGWETGRPIDIVSVEEEDFVLPLFVNADSGLEVVDVEVHFDSTIVRLVDVTTTETDWPGGLFFYNSLSVNNSVHLGGIALNGNIIGSRVHLADLHFEAISEGSSLIIVTNFSSETYQPFSSGDGEFVITVSSNNSMSCSVPSLQVEQNHSCPVDMPVTVGEMNYSCPINALQLAATSITDLVNNGAVTYDLSLGTATGTLEPVFAAQVHFELLALLQQLPTVTNSTRDILNNACDITISASLIASDGSFAEGLSTYFLIGLPEDTHVTGTLNFTQNVVSVGNGQVLRWLPAIYNSSIGEYQAIFQTSDESIPAQSLSLSVIQSFGNGSDLARLYPFFAEASGGEMLNFSLPSGGVFRSNEYTPLKIVDRELVCSLLPSSSSIPASSSAPALSSSSIIVTTTLTTSELTSSAVATTTQTPSLFSTLMASSASVSLSSLSATTLSSLQQATSETDIFPTGTSTIPAMSSQFLSSSMLSPSTSTPFTSSISPTGTPTISTMSSLFPSSSMLSPSTSTPFTSPISPIIVSSASMPASTQSVVMETNSSVSMVPSTTVPSSESVFTPTISDAGLSSSIFVEPTTTGAFSEASVESSLSMVTSLVSSSSLIQQPSSSFPLNSNTTVSLSPTLSSISPTVVSSSMPEKLSLTTLSTSTILSSSSITTAVSSVMSPAETSSVFTSSTSMLPTPPVAGFTKSVANHSRDAILKFTGYVSNMTDTLYTRCESVLNETMCECNSSEARKHDSWSTDYYEMSDETMITITKLQPFTIYRLQISRDGISQSEGQWFEIQTQEDVPERFDSSNIKISNMTTSIVVRWDPLECPNGRITSGNITLSLESKKKKRREVNVPPPINITEKELADRDVTVPGLTPGTRYSIKVCLCNSEGCTQPCPVVIGETDELPFDTTTMMSLEASSSISISSEVLSSGTTTQIPTAFSSSSSSSSSVLTLVTSMVTTTSSSSSTSPSNSQHLISSSSLMTDPGEQGPNIMNIVIPVVVIVIIMILVVVLALVVGVVVRQRRKTGGMAFYHRPNSQASKDYWFEVEENVEMNPIDIVPVEHQIFDDHYVETTLVDSVIENPAAHTISDMMPSRGASLNSINKPLIQRQNGTRFGRTTVHYTGTSEAPPPYQSEDTLKPGYDYDSESQIDLQFQEDYPQSQHYLSLGLTPLSQLSPDPVSMSNSGHQDFDFFPSMLPPVSAMTSVLNGPRAGNSGGGISVDDDDDEEDNSALNKLVMPDAMPGVPFIPEPKRPVGRRSRGERGEGMFSVPRTLEPLVEQRSLEADTGQQDFMSSSNSDDLLEMDHSYMPVFPTAMDSPTPKFSRKTSDQPSSHQQESFDSLFSKPVQNGYGEFRGNFNPIGLKEQARSRRQQAREEAKAEHRALLLSRKEEQEKTKKLKPREFQKNPLKDYATFNGSTRNPTNGILVQQETNFDMRFKEPDDSQSSPTLPVRSFPPHHIFPQQLTRTSHITEERSRNEPELNDITRVTNEMTAL